MGGNQSNLIPMPFGFDYMTIAFRYTDRIRIYYATDQEINIVREIIQRNWRGIQQEELKLGSGYQFKLKDNPFAEYSSAAEAIEARKLACHLLYGLYNQGIKLLISSDLTQTTDLATWLFHREQTVPAQFPFACIGVSGYDKLQFINFPQNMHSIFQDVVARNWPQTIQETKIIGDVYQIKLKGTPWSSMGGAENIQSKTLIKALLNDLEMRQWILYGSSNLRGNADTLFFRYDPSLPSDGSRLAGFVISLNRNDRLRLIDAPPESIECARSMVTQFWRRGLQQEKQKFNAYEFKMAGHPWWADGEEAVDTRFFMCKLFEGLMSIGWRVQIAIDLTRKLNDKSVLTFQRCAPMSVPMFCLSLNWTDKIRFINAPQNVVDALTAETKRVWLFGVARERMYGPSFELKLNGNPWSYGMNGHDGAHGRVLLKYLIKTCANMGWFVILSADVSAKFVHQDKGPDYPIDVHSLWFMRMDAMAPPPQAASGMPPLGFASGMQQQPGATFGFSTAPPAYAPPAY